VEESKLLSAYKALASHINDFITNDTDTGAKTIAAVQSHLAHIKSASLDASTSFNASEQIKDLQLAQKELDFLLEDFLLLSEAGIITKSQHLMLERCVHDCDEAIRNMSDPEYS